MKIIKILEENETPQITDATLALFMVCTGGSALSLWLGFVKLYEFLSF